VYVEACLQEIAEHVLLLPKYQTKAFSLSAHSLPTRNQVIVVAIELCVSSFPPSTKHQRLTTPQNQHHTPGVYTQYFCGPVFEHPVACPRENIPNRSDSALMLELGYQSDESPPDTQIQGRSEIHQQTEHDERRGWVLLAPHEFETHAWDSEGVGWLEATIWALPKSSRRLRMPGKMPELPD
jgi:hypothetical protein